MLMIVNRGGVEKFIYICHEKLKNVISTVNVALTQG